MNAKFSKPPKAKKVVPKAGNKKRKGEFAVPRPKKRTRRKKKKGRPKANGKFLATLFDEAQRSISCHDRNVGEIAERFCAEEPEVLTNLWHGMVIYDMFQLTMIF